MIIWINAQILPLIDSWIKQNYNINAIPVRDLGLLYAKDDEIYFEAKKRNAIILTKDYDFLDLVTRYGSPPQII